MGKKALIAMSGGVNFSVAAFLIKQAGYDCIGVTMKLFQNEDIGASRARTCCSLDDVEDARGAARRLGILIMCLSAADTWQTAVESASAI